jgi:hypothetical protein
MSNKSELAHALSVSRSSLYYVSKKEQRDWALKCAIEEVLRTHPSYGSRRIALALKKNRKGIQRVMRHMASAPTGEEARNTLWLSG